MPKQKTITVLGHEVILERRRYPSYGGTTYTWATLICGPRFEETSYVSLGDPWPCLTPPKKELEAAVRRALESAKPS